MASRLTGLSFMLAALALVFAPDIAGANAVATVLPADGLRLRAGPGSDQRIIDTIPGSARVAVTGAANPDGWYPVLFKGQRGWVMGAYLTLEEAGGASARRAAVAPADGLNLRVAPAETADVLTVLPAGRIVAVAARTTDDGWVVAQAGDRTGWVKASFLAFEPAATAAVAPAAGGPAVSTPGGAGPAAPNAGRATVRYYSSDFDGSRLACGGTFRSDDVAVAAANSWPCGAVLRVCNGANCVTVTVRDTGGMGANEIDLSMAGFSRLAPLTSGVITATVEVQPAGAVPTPAAAPPTAPVPTGTSTTVQFPQP